MREAIPVPASPAPQRRTLAAHMAIFIFVLRWEPMWNWAPIILISLAEAPIPTHIADVKIRQLSV
jgi:hypothetical protein